MMHTSSLASAQLPVGSATLTFGPWAERFEHVRDRAVPTMRDDLFDDVLSGARHNFEVATGRADGAHQGPPLPGRRPLQVARGSRRAPGAGR